MSNTKKIEEDKNILDVKVTIEIDGEVEEFGGPYTYTDNLVKELQTFHKIDAAKELALVYTDGVTETFKRVSKKLFEKVLKQKNKENK